MTVDTTLWVTLKLAIIEAKIPEWEIFFADMRAKVAAEEPGTLMFNMHRVQGQPGSYVMIERYADQAAWDAHSVKQGERGVVPEMMAFAAGPPEFLFLEAVAGPLR